MEKKQYKVGDEITVNGKWAVITEIEDGTIFAADQDGDEKEVNPNEIN